MVTEKNRQNNDNVQRMPAEEMYQREIDALIASEKDPVPSGWRMSPRSVLTYITGAGPAEWKSHRNISEINAWWKSPSPHSSPTAPCF